MIVDLEDLRRARAVNSSNVFCPFLFFTASSTSFKNLELSSRTKRGNSSIEVAGNVHFFIVFHFPLLRIYSVYMPTTRGKGKVLEISIVLPSELNGYNPKLMIYKYFLLSIIKLSLF